MDLGNGLGHLTYSTLVHPADNWEQLWDSLQTFVPKVKARVSPNAPFGVCIRLAAPTAELLAGNAGGARRSSSTFSPTTTCTSTRRTRFRMARSRARW